MTAARDHIANEFADMATNGLQWLRNIKEGISTVDDALAEMETNMERIRSLQAALVPKSPVRVKGYTCITRRSNGVHRTYHQEFNESHANEIRSTLHSDGLSVVAAEELIAKWNRLSADSLYVYALEG